MNFTETMVLVGHCPAKKNLWKRGKTRTYIDKDVSAQIDHLTVQAREQWFPRDPVLHPDITVKFYMRDKRRDRDNTLTTLLDCLRDSGVIKNDNVKDFNGQVVIEPAEIDGDERAVIRITGGKSK